MEKELEKPVAPVGPRKGGGVPPQRRCGVMSWDTEWPHPLSCNTPPILHTPLAFMHCCVLFGLLVPLFDFSGSLMRGFWSLFGGFWSFSGKLERGVM